MAMRPEEVREAYLDPASIGIACIAYLWHVTEGLMFPTAANSAL